MQFFALASSRLANAVLLTAHRTANVVTLRILIRGSRTVADGLLDLEGAKV
jgi:hypothetical protein